jgi:hypothetical protein
MAREPSKTRWFAVSAILYFRIKKSSRQANYLVWENVYLVRAESANTARRRASFYARAAAGDDGGDLIVNGRPATLVFGGVRKVVECLGDPTSFRPNVVKAIHDGVEATYSAFLVRGKSDLLRLIHGKPTKIVYKE